MDGLILQISQTITNLLMLLELQIKLDKITLKTSKLKFMNIWKMDNIRKLVSFGIQSHKLFVKLQETVVFTMLGSTVLMTLVTYTQNI